MAHITIGTTATRADYTASAGQTAFSVPFEFFDEDDLLVYKNNVLLTKTTHYTVTPVTTSDGGFDGGTVTLTSGNEASINDKVAIVLSMPYERSSDFPTAGPFNVTTLNTTLDKNAVRFKQIDERVSRALTGPTSEAGFAELPAKADRASRIMSFDTDGNPSTVATDSLSLATLQAFTDYKVTTGTGNGSNTTLTLSGDPGQEGNTQVYIDGVYQSKSNYSISGTTLTFSTAPPNGSAIEVVHGQAASTYAPPDNSIPYEKLLTSDIDTDLSSVSGSDDTLASAKAIKTYVDAQVTAQDLDFQADSGGALNIDLDSESLTLAGGTGIDTVGSGNTVTASVDSTVYRTGGTDVSVADGGTGASSHTAGGVLLGNGTGAIQNTGVLSDGQIIVGDGSGNPALESGATLRTSIGVGTGDSPQFTGLTLTGDATIGDDLHLDSDGAVLKFGDDAEVTITHVADTGLKLEDNDKIIWGAGSDGNIYSDGTNFTFASASEHHYSNAFQFSNGGASATLMTATNGGSVDLYHNGIKKLETTASGATVTGGISTTGDATIGGNVTAPAQPAFFVYPSARITDVTGDGTSYTAVYNTEVFDQGSNFASNTFTAPVAGKYQFNVNVSLLGIVSGHTTCIITLVTSNRSIRTHFKANVFSQTGAGDQNNFNGSVLTDMDASDTAYVTINVGGGSKVVDFDGDANIASAFSGFLVA